MIQSPSPSPLLISYSCLKDTLSQLDVHQLACILVDYLFQYPQILKVIDVLIQRETEEVEELVWEMLRDIGNAPFHRANNPKMTDIEATVGDKDTSGGGDDSNGSEKAEDKVDADAEEKEVRVEEEVEEEEEDDEDEEEEEEDSDRVIDTEPVIS